MTEAEILEQSALDRLLDKPKKLKIGGRTYSFRQPYLSTLDHLSNILIKLEFDESALNDADSTTKYASRLKRKNAKNLARYVAYFWLEKPWKIRLFGWFMTIHFYNRLKPSELFRLVIELKVLENDPDFINSTRVVAQMPRTSAPKANLVEQQA